jgi:hypothetical protein
MLNIGWNPVRRYLALRGGAQVVDITDAAAGKDGVVVTPHP